MIKWFQRWKAQRQHERQLAICRDEGHYLELKGDVNEGRMTGGGPVLLGGKSAFEIYGCKCGYHEINDTGRPPYRRDFEDGERLKREASIPKERIMPNGKKKR